MRSDFCCQPFRLDVRFHPAFFNRVPGRTDITTGPAGDLFAGPGSRHQGSRIVCSEKRYRSTDTSGRGRLRKFAGKKMSGIRIPFILPERITVFRQGQAAGEHIAGPSRKVSPFIQPPEQIMKKAFRFPGRHYRNDAVKKRAQQGPPATYTARAYFCQPVAKGKCRFCRTVRPEPGIRNVFPIRDFHRFPVFPVLMPPFSAFSFRSSQRSGQCKQTGQRRYSTGSRQYGICPVLPLQKPLVLKI